MMILINFNELWVKKLYKILGKMYKPVILKLYIYIYNIGYYFDLIHILPCNYSLYYQPHHLYEFIYNSWMYLTLVYTSLDILT